MTFSVTFSLLLLILVSNNFTDIFVLIAVSNAFDLIVPEADNRGTIEVEYEIYFWLKSDRIWNGVDTKEFDENPTTVTFSLFRGNNRIIYQREVNN